MPAASLGTVAVMGLLALAAVLGEWREAVEARRRADEARRQAERAGAAERWERYRVNIGAASANQLQQSDTARRALEAAPREHRGWEWRHLRSQLDDSRAVLHGTKPLEVFLWPRPVISPTGDRIATIDGEGAAIRLWDATTGAAVGLLRGHEGPVLVLCYSPDGKRLASGSADHPALGPGRRETCGGPERAREAGRVAGVRPGRAAPLLDGQRSKLDQRRFPDGCSKGIAEAVMTLDQGL